MRGGRANSEDGSAAAEQDVPAVAYVRMSTDHQKYSTENQLDVLRSYAAARGLQILRVFEDSGRSGLRLDGREALQNLMAEVQSGQADFKAILVYDVSRWGRFQDADEGAYHEHVCSRAGIRVHYCGEQFENDGSIGSNLLKTVKRVMAGEYSRELSVKVFAGQCRLVELGYRQGGAAGYGLRRVLIDEHGNSKGELSRGEQKSLQTDRVILVPGPKEEQRVVQRMYEMFVNEGRPEREIAEALNAGGYRTDLDRLWTRATVHQVLTNEKYIGNNVFAKVSFKLKQRRVVNPREMWIRAEGAYPAIVDQALFRRAREIVDARSRHFSDGELLDALRAPQASGHAVGADHRRGRRSAVLQRLSQPLRQPAARLPFDRLRAGPRLQLHRGQPGPAAGPGAPSEAREAGHARQEPERRCPAPPPGPDGEAAGNFGQRGQRVDHRGRHVRRRSRGRRGRRSDRGGLRVPGSRRRCRGCIP